ncbi:hypothetical protein GCM10010116_01670 [Microbispora rosea subsp. aerata]|nr:hypothetical protein GCM10010116_01670 [Microbispora rosea subsp. aerata]
MPDRTLISPRFRFSICRAPAGMPVGLGDGLGDWAGLALGDGLGLLVTPPVQVVPLSAKLAGAGLDESFWGSTRCNRRPWR